MKFFLDANLSLETAQFLRQRGHEAITATEVGLASAADEALFRYAAVHNAFLITFDLDFGYLFRVFRQITVGTIILRLENQTVESVNRALQRLLVSKVLENPANHHALVVMGDRTIRVRR